MLAALALAACAAAASAGPLDYAPSKFSVTVSTESEDARGRVLTLTFPSAVKSPFKPNDTVWGHLVLPKGEGPFPAILVLPVMAAPNVWIETQFVKRFQKDGFAVLWLEMPYQFHRRAHPSEPSGQVFLARTARRLAANFRQSVLDARRALQVLRARPEVDAARIGVFGISLGSIVGAATYSVDPTPKFAVLMMGGADFPSLIVASSLSGPFARKMGLTRKDVEEAWRGIDPLDYAAQNKGKPALLVNVRADTVIPTANGLKMKEAFPDARQVWLPLGHYTGILHLVWVPRYVSRAFQAGLAAADVKKR